MGLRFEWNEGKAETNHAKHGVRFEEAATVFGDALSLTIADPAHSAAEDRFVSMGRSSRGRLLVVGRGGSMKKKGDAADAEEIRDEYDFAAGTRGKYAPRHAEGTNIVVLDADVAEHFPDSPSVNEALRALVRIAARQRRRAS